MRGILYNRLAETNLWKTDTRFITTVLKGCSEGANNENFKILCTHLCNTYTNKAKLSFGQLWDLKGLKN
jgi:hypothetical protein